VNECAVMLSEENKNMQARCERKYECAVTLWMNVQSCWVKEIWMCGHILNVQSCCEWWGNMNVQSCCERKYINVHFHCEWMCSHVEWRKHEYASTLWKKIWMCSHVVNECAVMLSEGNMNVRSRYEGAVMLWTMRKYECAGTLWMCSHVVNVQSCCHIVDVEEICRHVVKENMNLPSRCEWICSDIEWKKYECTGMLWMWSHAVNDEEIWICSHVVNVEEIWMCSHVVMWMNDEEICRHIVKENMNVPSRCECAVKLWMNVQWYWVKEIWMCRNVMNVNEWCGNMNVQSCCETVAGPLMTAYCECEFSFTTWLHIMNVNINITEWCDHAPTPCIHSMTPHSSFSPLIHNMTSHCECEFSFTLWMWIRFYVTKANYLSRYECEFSFTLWMRSLFHNLTAHYECAVN